MAYRLDIVPLRPAQEMPGGRMKVDGYITRTGVFEYRNADGTVRREYRSPDEVFRPESLASFSQIPVTNDHPPQHIDSSVARQYTVGMTGENVIAEDTHVRTSLVIFDGATVNAMKAGKVELSCGYEVDVVNTPGISPEGEHYDAVQTNIRGNHVALVETGRAGPTARVRMDSTDKCAILVAPLTPTEETHMDELQKLLASALATSAAEKTRADAAEAKAVALEARAIAAEASATAEKTRADAAEKARTDAAAGEPARIRARVELETKAAAFLGAEFKADASDRDLMVSVVKRLDSFDIKEDASPEAVALCFANACARAGSNTAALAAVRAAATTGARADADVPDEAAAQRKMNEDSANAWKTPFKGEE